MLYFQDESGVFSDTSFRKNMGTQRKNANCKSNWEARGLCISSAISPAGRLAFRIEKEKVTRFTFVDFLIKIMKQHPHRKVIIVTDNAPAHTAKFVKEFVLSNDRQIAVYYISNLFSKVKPGRACLGLSKSKKVSCASSSNNR